MTMHGETPRNDDGRFRAWRGLLFFLPLALWTLGGAAVISILAMISQGFRKRGSTAWIRVWGRVPLAVCGVQLEVHGLEHRDRPGAKLFLFNHVSLLDLFVMGALCPPRAIVLYKREFERIPGLGWAFKALGMIPVDRGNLESAIRSVSEAGRRIVAEGANCVMAPEGTRSRRGGLQPFKMGAFHLAAEHGIPIVPLIMRGVERVLPMGSFLVRSGRVRVDLLAPIDTSRWSTETVREHGEEVRQLFLRYLAPEAPDGEDS